MNEVKIKVTTAKNLLVDLSSERTRWLKDCDSFT